MVTKEELNEIVELASSVPEEYKTICFELLLSSTLQAKQPAPTAAALPPIPHRVEPTPTDEGGNTPPRPHILPIDVKAFLSQYGLDESIIWKYFVKHGEEIRPIYQLKVTRRATAQIQHALMLALENAIGNGQFQVEVETLRNHCIEQKCYEHSNFRKNIQRNARLFRSVTNDDPLTLSPDGKSELAELLELLKG